MADNKIYCAIGEEANRGTAESTTVGFVPLLNSGIPKAEFDEKNRAEFRGEDSILGDTTVISFNPRARAGRDCLLITY